MPLARRHGHEDGAPVYDSTREDHVIYGSSDLTSSRQFRAQVMVVLQYRFLQGRQTHDVGDLGDVAINLEPSTGAILILAFPQEFVYLRSCGSDVAIADFVSSSPPKGPSNAQGHTEIDFGSKAERPDARNEIPIPSHLRFHSTRYHRCEAVQAKPRRVAGAPIARLTTKVRPSHATRQRQVEDAGDVRRAELGLKVGACANVESGDLAPSMQAALRYVFVCIGIPLGHQHQGPRSFHVSKQRFL